MIPQVDHVAFGERLDFGKVHHHAVVRPIAGIDDAAAERDFEGIAVAVQVPALALVIGNPVARVEFEAAGDAHGRERLVCGKVPAPLRCAEAAGL
jgi:hypothetical protein